MARLLFAMYIFYRVAAISAVISRQLEQHCYLPLNKRWAAHCTTRCLPCACRAA